MDKELMKKLALVHEVNRQNRIVELRLKYDKTKNKRLKEQYAKMIKNLSN